jgi:hypothetical protein
LKSKTSFCVSSLRLLIIFFFEFIIWFFFFYAGVYILSGESGFWGRAVK